MITQVNGIGSNAALSKKAKPAAMDLDRVRIPRDIAFTGAPEKATGFLKSILDGKFFNGVKDFVTKKVPGFFTGTVPKYAKIVGDFFKKFLPKAKDVVGE